MSTEIAVDGEGLTDLLDRLAGFGGSDGGGVDRVAFSEEDLAARDWLDRRLERAGLSVSRDAIGNSVAELPGSQPELGWIGIGSHSDSVPAGGRYDGALGVAAAVVCAEAIRDHGLTLRHGLRVINFEAEEATMGSATLGSHAAAGKLDSSATERLAYDGASVRSHLVNAGIEPDRLPEARRTSYGLAAFLELHIEQGPALERADVPIGIVEGLAGIRRYEVEFQGTPNHAGTTPMSERDDALVAASEFVIEVRSIALRHSIVGTVGTLQVSPGAPNVIPGRVRLTLELRSRSDQSLSAAEEDVLACGAGLTATITALPAKLPQSFSTTLTGTLGKLCEENGFEYRRMWSGAGHDAGVMAELTDAAMIFVPSRNGVSHSTEEYTDPGLCRTGAQLLLLAILELDRIGIDPG